MGHHNYMLMSVYGPANLKSKNDKTNPNNNTVNNNWQFFEQAFEKCMGQGRYNIFTGD